jgi:hypothetical protein
MLVVHLILVDDDVLIGGWHHVFIASFHPHNIHDWWQNDMHVQDIIWKCDYDKVISNMTKE